MSCTHSFFTRFLPHRARRQPDPHPNPHPPQVRAFDFVVRAFRPVDPATSEYQSRINILRYQEESPFSITPILDDMATDAHRHKRARHDHDKPKKETCRICCTEIDGPYLTPCLNCRKAQCYDCVKKHFQMALKDREQMPPGCCTRAFYFNVAKGILPPTELEAYKQRWEEIQTPNPFYCPVPTCSTFIPPRILKPVHGKVTCHVCKAISCVKCKQVARFDHTCAPSTEGADLIDKYKYKRCPKCNGGVSKMYGCAHVRCSCGAHWCWDCQRPINLCYSKPCSRARDDGGDMSEPDDGDVLSESDDETITNEDVQRREGAPYDTRATVSDTNLILSANNSPRQQIEHNQASGRQPTQRPRARSLHSLDDVPTPPRSAASFLALRSSSLSGGTSQPAPADHLLNHLLPAENSAITTSPPGADTTENGAANQGEPAAPATLAPEIINLDDSDREDVNWEGGEYDFGDEPEDEDWDIWGCLHRFEILTMPQIPDKWFVGINKKKTVKVECVSCYRVMKIEPVKHELEAGATKGGNKSDKQPLADGTVVNAAGPSTAPGVNTVHDEQLTSQQLESKQEKNLEKTTTTTPDKKLAAYCCSWCGTVNCWSCRRSAMRMAEMFRLRKE